MIVPGLDERDARFSRLRAAAQAQGLDALIVAGKGHWWTGRGYVRYLTDFHLWGHDGLILLPLERDPVLVMTSYAVGDKMAQRGWITDARGDVYLAPRMADAVREAGLAQGRIGLVGERSILGAGVRDELVAALPGVRFSRADELFDRIRAVKSPLELEQERALWRDVLAAMTRFQETVRPGVLGSEIAAEVTRPLWAGGARDILIFMGEDPSEVSLPQPEPLRCDDKTRFHLEVCGPSGHWCEVTINLAWRPPSDAEARLMDAEVDAFERLRAAARPGARLSELAALFEATLRDHGLAIHGTTDHFDFHGQGMDTIEYPWHAQAPGWGQSQDWALEAGMVFSYHPRRQVVGHRGWSTGLNEDIVITEQGAERLSGGWDQRWRPMPERRGGA
jgi:Xaa-Pro aminopeptidase